MNMVKFLVQKKILIGLLAVLVVMIGSFSVLKLDKELMPPLDFDAAYVSINAGDVSTIEIERTITTPLEKELLAIKGVEDTQSTTTVGNSSIQLSLTQGQGDELIKEVESVVQAKTTEISSIKDFETGLIGTSQSYDFYMVVSGGDMDEMSTFAKDTLEPRLEDLPEVRDVALMGTLEHEAVIEFDREAVVESGLDISQIITMIQQSNTEATVGSITTKEESSSSLRWQTTLTSSKDIEDVKLATSTGFIELGDIATVSIQPLESSSSVWKDGNKDLVFVQIGRTSDATQIEMAQSVREEVQRIRDENLINSSYELDEMVSQADYVQDSIDGVTTNILIGSVIAIVILLLFLRNIRATIIVGLSIPTSVLLTVTVMWLFDYSLNILTLIGLGLGIGMMVDSSIVILESIYQKKEQGLKNLEAVITGTKEVATAVIASMLTTIVVFLPIGMLGGEMGQFMIMLSIVVAITLISSVIVSFSLIPALSEKFLKVKDTNHNKPEGKLLRKYGNIINWVVKKKRNSLAVIGLFLLIFVSSLFLITKIPMTIMPDVFNRYAEIMVNVETGLSKPDKEALIKKINQELSKIEDVETNYVMDDNVGMLYSVINMTTGNDIIKEQEEVNEEIFRTLRALQDDYPIKSVQGTMSGGDGGYPVQVNIEGENFEQLSTLGEDFMEDLSNIDGIVGISSSIDRTSPEQQIELNQTEIEKANLSQLQMKQYLEQTFLNLPIGEMTVAEETVPLLVKWDDKIETTDELLTMKVPTQTGETALGNLISLKTVETPNEITHVDGERYISISADIDGKDLGSINREVQQLIKKYDSPNGYTISVAGDLEQQQQLIQDMIIVLAIAIFLVYFVMAVQFNHLIHPIIVMSVIPMTIVGVILGLFLTQQELSAMTGMGVIMLIGIVLNNAILLIDRTNQLRNQGYLVDRALIIAGKDRIRPIFMTTLTTAGGMLPLALASGTTGNYQAPMATAIISGLLFATFITLLLIPAVYRLFTKKDKQQIEQYENNSVLQKKTV
ncbi:efflux RND transporter permease subunit [Aquibacillus rhizosphaerae]|uniref:Efflux RND transporter permease subunit n=1 Tax=Aquibacillus rhizosphaerae TaxID=3051431 RepID=A0ABT7L7F7_9BACI|nr:efflux RND transporter permease subunit [Aquibacillus sp. LR5S19]MDL4841796.1 efflux RND transporter permease subunit [Aquibacillus sp. LR5S19]